MATPTIPKPPTALIGTVDDSTWSGWLAEAIEYVPDLAWPLSVGTYGQMRRDPQLAAIVAAYTLPIRRATWMVDPAGCRPEVAALVADDLGLPVAGQDQPGAARTRGVSWAEHLRVALGMLTFGHAGFEVLAEVRDNQARLVGLYERSQASITEIHTDQLGDFAGISQAIIGRGVEIPATRMVWYVHEREATAWHGTSLLRPAYAPWLIKRECQRILATSSRRFGMGVPTVRALPGTAPTPAQMAEAAQVAQQMRGGEQAGAAIPPGFVVELQGMLGGAPDTLAFTRWLDQQMSGMALARWMDLGDTPNGSRALGESFIDLFMLSLQAIADQLADAVTRQAAARLVAWNWGDDEPVPRVAVADVGSRREVTAEALNTLLASGALSADPGLEEWVRREYRLPGRTSPPEPAPAPKTTPVAAARRRRPRQAGQQALPIAAAADGEPSPEAQADAEDHDAAVAVLLAALPLLAAPIVAALIAAVTAGLAAGGGTALTRLVLGPDGDAAVDALAGRIGEEMFAVAQRAADRAIVEVGGFGADLAYVAPDELGIVDQAQAAAHLIADGLSQAATRAALLHAGDTISADAVTAAVREALDAQVAAETGWVAQTVGGAVTVAQHEGRMAVMDQLNEQLGDVVTWTADEVNDRNQCAPCKKIDGIRFESYADAKAAYPTGRYVACLGRDRCRGRLVPTVA